tara:strand:- start:179 stop:373 length:195 start_codon:yes stop_codon:yes gene_type:complete
MLSSERVMGDAGALDASGDETVVATPASPPAKSTSGDPIGIDCDYMALTTRVVKTTGVTFVTAL